MNILILATTSLLLGCQKKEGPDRVPEPPVSLHTIYELNREDGALDSHAGEEAYSVLEMDFNSYVVVSPSALEVTTPHYSRVKKTAAGTYLLFYQDAQVAKDTYIAHSTDLKNWSSVEQLFTSKSINTPGGVDSRRYSTCDAAVLTNGDIIAVASFRANQGYRHYPEYNGVAMRRSTDNGVTWGAEQVIYVGTNWEPYLLELPNGDLHCYFTDTDPQIRNSGTSMVVSKDGGVTWQPTGTSNGYKVFRQYKYMDEGQQIYTDQMPVVRMLNDGRSLVGFLEARMEAGPDDGNSTYWMSLVYGQENWVPLTGDEVGPADRTENLFMGAGGYLAQFPSGETLISCNIQRKFSMKLGDSKAREFNHASWDTDWLQPFEHTGVWGSVEITGSHEAVGTMRCNDGIMIARFILNHRIDAPRSIITVDGHTDDWTDSQALFLGSESEAQTVVRAASDGNNLYVLAERKDSYINTGDNIDIYLHGGSANGLDENSLRLRLGPDGLMECNRYVGGEWIGVDVPGVTMENILAGIIDDGGRDTGYVTEIAVPRSAIGLTGDNVFFNAVATNRIGGDVISDTFTSTVVSEPDTWMRIGLTD